ncbi:unnamed protein product [Chrysodeixis includens]|uniref:Lipocalin/cytosolic fatty-acid binding domain-containing protein n=1 Tax=Chrysodeixis includens TaxID=689277 RepID=A0A9P0BX21_CHRIL|nr:unnamed protein product [Chrysodeixis includens]
MSYFGKTYNHVRHENFDTFLKEVGLPEDKVKEILETKPSVKIVKNGDSYTSTVITKAGAKDTTFKSGVEFDDTIGADKTPIKSTYIVDGNTVTQKIRGESGDGSFVREYNGDELVVTISSPKFKGVAKQFFKA